MTDAALATRAFAMSPDELARYARDGFVVRERVFDPAEVAAIAAECEQLIADLVAMRHGKKITYGTYMFERRAEIAVTVKWEPDAPDVVQGIEPFAHYYEPLRLRADDRRMKDPCLAICQADDVELFTEKLNVKRAHDGGGYILHQDFPYWEPLEPVASRVATAMLFLDDANLTNGCLEVAPGSHTVGKHPQRQDVTGFGGLEIDNDRFDLTRLQPVEVPAGSVVFFGAFLAHRSMPNRSNKDRRALLYSYQPAGHPHSRLVYEERARKAAAETEGRARQA